MRALILLAGLLALPGCDRQKDAGSQAAPAAAARQAGLDRSQAGKPAPAVTFRDPDGEEASLTDFRGRPLLVNLWATWCAPCVKELPTLAALADRPGAPQVLALSQDMGEQAKVAAFLTERKIGFEAFQDAEMAMSSALGANVLPTTVLFGSDGKEIWRYTGDLDWTGAKAAELLQEAR
jgi:thiol-disulfide isomerase/thioredoxin